MTEEVTQKLTRNRKLTIDPELEKFLPSPRGESDEELQSLIMAAGGVFGVYAIQTWNGVIVDGHRRYRICERLKLPYDSVELSFKDKNEVKLWMDETQTARRNLNPYDLKLTRSRAVKYRAALKGNLAAAVEDVAKQSGVSTRTAYRDAQYARHLEKIPEQYHKVLFEMQAGDREVWNLSVMKPEVVHRIMQGCATRIELRQRIAVEKQGRLDRQVDPPRPTPPPPKHVAPPEPPKPRPFSQSKAMELVFGAQQALGALNRYTSSLCDLTAHHERYKQVRYHLATLDTKIAEWKRHIEG